MYLSQSMGIGRFWFVGGKIYVWEQGGLKSHAHAPKLMLSISISI